LQPCSLFAQRLLFQILAVCDQCQFTDDEGFSIYTTGDAATSDGFESIWQIVRFAF
jgi:hypothetical protein